MAKGYAEGPAAEEAERRREELAAGEARVTRATRVAVEGCTAAEPERHFLGWADEVDPDELFASGAAWGIRLVRRSSASVSASVSAGSVPPGSVPEGD